MKRKLSIFLFFTISGFLLTAQSETPIPGPVIDNIKMRVDSGNHVGIVVGIVDEQGSRFYSYGFKSLAKQDPVDLHTVFEIGSISKTFTGVLLAEKVVTRTMNLDDPIQKHLPASVKIPQKDGQSVSLKHVANHTSAIPRLPSNMKPANPLNPYADYTVQQMYDFLAECELPRAIGAKYEYSNLAMGLLGHLLALKSKMTYEELMLDKIAKPLGLTQTKIQLNDDMKASLAEPHDLGLKVENWDIPAMAGAGGIRSTPEELLTYVAAHLEEDGSDLSKAMQLAQKTEPVGEDQQPKVGLAWHSVSSGDLDIVFHTGQTGGYHSFAGFCTQNQTGVVVLTNSTENIDNIGFHLIDPKMPLLPFTKPPAINAKKKEIKLKEEILQAYVGKYQLAPQFFIDVTLEAGQLYLQATNQPRFPLFASSENEFFLKVVEAQITFNRKDSEEVSGLTLFQNGGQVPGKKIKEE